jgi:hypothetical protein
MRAASTAIQVPGVLEHREMQGMWGMCDVGFRGQSTAHHLIDTKSNMPSTPIIALTHLAAPLQTQPPGSQPPPCPLLHSLPHGQQ